MIKREELTNPSSCMSRAREDEMTFVLLARDVTAPDTIRWWAHERIRLGKNTWDDPQIVEAFECANEMDRQRRAQTPTPPSAESAALAEQPREER